MRPCGLCHTCLPAEFGIAKADIGIDDAAIAKEIGRPALHGETAVLEHQSAFGKAQGHARVLLGDENRRTVGNNLASEA
jgi:hypothetical protein